MNNEDFLRDPHQTIVFTSIDASLVVTYHKKTRTHVFWCAHRFAHAPHKSFRVLSERQRELRHANRMSLAPYGKGIPSFSTCSPSPLFNALIFSYE